MVIFWVLWMICSASALSGQEKKALDERAYEEWLYLQSECISPDGRWVAYEQRNKMGCRRIVIHGESATDTIVRGRNLKFSPDSKFACYELYDKDNKSSKLNYWMNLETKDTAFIPEVTSAYFIPGREAMLHLTRKVTDTTVLNTGIKYPLTDLTLFSLSAGDSVRFTNVVSYKYAGDGAYLLLSQKKDSSLFVSVYDLNNKQLRRLDPVYDGNFDFTAACFNPKLDKLAVLKRTISKKDTIKSVVIFELPKFKPCDSIIPGSALLPESFGSLTEGALQFSESGDRLYFKIKNSVSDVGDTTRQKVKSDLSMWKWDAPYIPTMNRLHPDQIRKSKFCQYDLKKKRVVVLSDEDMPYFQFPQGEVEDLTLGFNNLNYLREEVYKPASQYDSYLVDIKTGNKQLILRKSFYLPTISVDKKYVVWFEIADSCWYSMDTKTLTKKNLTAEIDDIFYNDEQDIPMHVTNFGLAGWTDKGHTVLIHSKTDLWAIDAAGHDAPCCLTKGMGRKAGIRFRYIKRKDDERYIDLKANLYLEAFQHRTKKSGYYVLTPTGDCMQLVFSDHLYKNLKFSEDRSHCIWRRQSFTEYPEVYKSDSLFKEIEKLSVSDSIQQSYLWGTSELVEWESFAKDSLQGILCKPENFDPSQKYPMLVYFYEKRSDNLNRYNIPSPIATVINWSYCVSNGYLVFIPDVVFRKGEPGASSYDAVVSGVKSLIDRYDFIDKDRIALNGHSWGGYQIAFLVTRTNMFKAAVSGAPVVNMTSAYGGIRWESGKSRMFQYEQTQSRIGGTLWDKPAEFIRNSPLFFLPQVQTPVLIMHNDKDGSVMWEQGIEFFMALRRLDKPVWLFNYKGEGHHLKKWENRLDYSRRVMEFYDYYLKDGKKPEWMKS